MMMTTTKDKEFGEEEALASEMNAIGERPLSLKAVQALKRLYGTEYQVGSGADLLYEASGASHDYAKGSLNIPYSFLIELRPQNTLHSTGFLLPEAEIMDTAEETWEAVKVVADEVLNRFGIGAWKNSSPPATFPASSTTTDWLPQALRTTTTTTTPNSTTTNGSTTTTLTLTTATTTTTSATTSTPFRTTFVRGRKTKTTKHTFRPNTIGTTVATTPHVLTSKSFPVATTLAPPPSSRNAKSGPKMSKPRPGPSSSSAASSGEKGAEQKTIVNVKICTGGTGLGRGVIPPFPPAPPSPASGVESGDGGGDSGNESGGDESGDEEQGGGTLMEILLPPPQTPRRLVKCRDWSAYCKWWRMHSLCSDPRVKKMCTLSCLIECQI